jgi:chromosome segregation ATPase
MTEAKNKQDVSLKAIENDLCKEPKTLAEEMSRRYKDATSNQEAEIAKQKQKIEKLKQDVDTNKNNLDTKQTEQKKQQEELNALQEKYANKQEELKKINNQTNAEKHTEVQKEADEIAAEYKKKQKNIKDIQTEIDVLKKPGNDLQTAKTELDKLENDFMDLKKGEAEHEATVEKFKKNGWENITDSEKASLQIREKELADAEKSTKNQNLVGQVGNALGASGTYKTLNNAQYKSFNEYIHASDAHKKAAAGYYGQKRSILHDHMQKVQTVCSAIKSVFSAMSDANKGRIMISVAEQDKAADLQDNTARFIESILGAVADVYDKTTGTSKDRWEQLLSELRQRLMSVIDLGGKLGNALTSSSSLA